LSRATASWTARRACWALSTREIAARAGIPPEEVLRFDGNTPPDPPPTASAETVAEALARINAYRHGGLPELLQAIADYNGVQPENVVLGAGADDILMLCARAYAGPGDTVAVADERHLRRTIEDSGVALCDVEATERICGSNPCANCQRHCGETDHDEPPFCFHV